MRLTLAGLGAATILATSIGAQPAKPQGVLLGGLTWPEAEKVLQPAAVVVIPLGIATEQQGPHLKLDSNDRLVRYLAERVRASADVVVAPSVPYFFNPAYLDYPGSTSISRTAARDMTADIVRTLASYGPKRFYVLNTAATALFPLKDAAEALADQGILLGYTDIRYRLLNARVSRQQAPVQRGPAHADEIATSMMLFLDPSAVDMQKAVREYGAGTGAMTRKTDGPGVVSASGVLGDPTLATREKGQGFVDAIVAGALEDIESVRSARLPAAKTTAAPAPPAPAARPQPARPEPQQPNGCMPSDERAIRSVGDAFSYLWRQMDAEKIAALFTANADMRHPDGTIERGQIVIYNNRRELFNKPEFRGSVHAVSLSDIRCISPTVAIADGKWELRLEDPVSPGGAPARNLGPGKRHSGWCTLVLTGGGGSWLITAWRYTVNPPDGSEAPTTLKQPGFIGRGGQ